MGTVNASIGRTTLLVALVGCGPGPTEPNSPQPTTNATSTTKVTPTKPIAMPSGPDCSTKAMEKLSATIMDTGMRSDLDAGTAVQEEVNPPDATAVLSALSSKLTACNPTEIEGCAYLTTSVEKDGTVSAVEPFVSDALPADVVTCLTGVLRGARFQPLPKAGKMQVPVTFSRSR